MKTVFAKHCHFDNCELFTPDVRERMKFRTMESIVQEQVDEGQWYLEHPQEKTESDVSTYAYEGWVRKKNRFVEYFEVRVVRFSAGGVVSVGLSMEGFPFFSQVGWKKGSIGYHSDDGNIFKESGEPFFHLQSSFQMGDVVGVGLIWKNHEMFFTKNGKRVTPNGILTNISEGIVFPAIGLDHASVVVNFGEIPFEYPIESIERMESHADIQQVKHIELDHSNVHEMIRDYLITKGCPETLVAFNSAMGIQTIDQTLKELYEKKRILNHLQNREIDQLLSLITEFDERFVQKNPLLYRDLLCQQFIEYIRNHKISEAMELITSGKFYEYREDEIVIEVIGLIAYEDLSRYQGNLLKEDRFELENRLNSVLSGKSCLEKLVEHMQLLLTS